MLNGIRIQTIIFNYSIFSCTQMTNPQKIKILNVFENSLKEEKSKEFLFNLHYIKKKSFN